MATLLQMLTQHVFSANMCCPSATFAVWSSAWLAGSAASDDVLDALLAWGDEHEVFAADPGSAQAFDLPELGAPPAGPVPLLASLRRQGQRGLRLVLPVAGDVRGLDGGGAFTAAALRAGEAVLLGDLDYGIVPEPVAEGLLRWSLFTLRTPARREYVSLAEAERGLTDAIRDSAGALQAADVARERPDVRTELAARVRSASSAAWPEGIPTRTVRVLQRAEEVNAIVELANADDPGGAVSASSAHHRAEALRPLADAIRTARCAAVDEATRVFSEAIDRQS